MTAAPKPTLTLTRPDTLLTVEGFIATLEKITGRKVTEAEMPGIERAVAQLLRAGASKP